MEHGFNISCLSFDSVCSLVFQYSSTGCLLTLHHSEKPDHEEVCEFRPYTCPCPGATCKWHGSLEAVMPHLMHAHKSITTLQVSTKTTPVRPEGLTTTLHHQIRAGGTLSKMLIYNVFSFCRVRILSSWQRTSICLVLWTG